MKSVKCLLLAIGLFCMVAVKAQGVNLRLDSNFTGFPSNVHMNEVDTLTIVIKNDSASDFTGKISIGYDINGTGAGAADSASKPFFYPFDSDTIFGHNEIVRTLIVHVNPPFIIGSSGVVIWPIVQNSPILNVHISDSLSISVNVLPAVGIDEITERKLKVYMSGPQLVIQNNGGYLLKDVKLYDVAGNLLQEQQFSVSGKMDMNEYASGVYFARVTFADNATAVVKVINTK